MVALIQKFIFDDELLDKLADTLFERLGTENTTLPILRRQLAEVEKCIENLLNAIQAGIFTSSTIQRLESLESEKQERSVQIIKEEISKPNISKEEILFYLTKYRKLNMKQLDHRRRLIDSFVNAIYLFDDKLVITFNYKEGTKTVTFAEIEEVFGSDLSLLSVPTKKDNHRLSFFVRMRNRARHARERTRQRSFKDTTAWSDPWQVHSHNVTHTKQQKSEPCAGWRRVRISLCLY